MLPEWEPGNDSARLTRRLSQRVSHHFSRRRLPPRYGFHAYRESQVDGTANYHCRLSILPSYFKLKSRTRWRADFDGLYFAPRRPARAVNRNA